MTLVVVLMYGLGFVLIASAIETDPKTGKSVSITQTISDVWNDQLDFSQPGSAGNASSQVNTSVAQTPSTSTLSLSQFQQSAIQQYLNTRTQ